MSITLLHSIFIGMTIAGAVFTAIGVFGNWRTGAIINQAKDGEILKLQKNIIELQPRKIITEQRLKLVESLSKKKGKIGFISKLLDSESEDFATELSEIFREAGWQTVEPINRTLLDDFEKGLNIFAKPELKEYADLVVKSLNEVGILIWPQPIRDGSLSGNFDENAIYIAVDSKKTAK